VKVGRKTKYFDHNKGTWVYPKEPEIEDTGININHLPWKGENMPAQAETIVRFEVSGFSASPDDVLKDLGLEAAHLWRAGESRTPKTLLRHKENGFRIEPDKDIEDFEERLANLLDKIRPAKSRLANLNARCQLACVCYLSGSERPVIHFPPDTLAELSELRASIDTDLYYLSDEE
jgi:hypothetical protein